METSTAEGVVDAHHHVWDLSARDQDWITGQELTLLRRDFLLADLESDWDRWSVEDLRPYADTVLDAFGPRRLMFGSDWPVCRLAATYAEVVTSARELTAELHLTERREVFTGTALRTYGLTATVSPAAQEAPCA